MEKVKVVNNVHGSLGFFLNPTPESLRVLPKQGAFLNITDEEIQYIFINQEIIQKGMLWIDNKDQRIKLGLEKEDGTKENKNILQHDEIVGLVSGNYKKLEKVLGEISESTTLSQFVEVARELKIDSKGKIDMIEKAAKTKIFDDEE